MTTLAEVRAKFPQYADVSDVDLAARLHAKFYKDVPMDQFVKAIGLVEAQREEYSPTEGTGALQRGWEAFGSALPRMARGVKQMLPGGNQEEETEARELDKPLMDTTAGKVGRVLGTAAVTAPAFMVGGGIPAAMAAGGAVGAMEPTVEGESRLGNAAMGAGGGAGGVLAGRAIPAGYRAARATLDPLYRGGQRQIAARALARTVDDPAALAAQLRGGGSQVPGVAPTTAEVAQQVGPARLEKSLRQRNSAVADDMTAQQEANNAARLDDLGQVAGTDAQMTAATGARETAANTLYGQARGIATTPAEMRLLIQNDVDLAAIAQRPAMRIAMRQAETNTRNVGGQAHQGDYLHRVKMALDGMIDTGPQRGIDADTLRAVASTRDDFLRWLETRNPPYQQARQTYAQMSQPINQMEAGREIVRRSTGNVQDRLGNATLHENKLGGVLKNNPELLDDLTPQQRQIIERVLQDVGRTAGAQRLAAAGGSDTAQNMIGQNLLSEGLGGVSPLLAKFANTRFGNAIGAVLQQPYRLAGSQQAVERELAELLANPRQAAAALENVTPSERARILAALLNNTNAAIGSTAAVAP